MTLYMFKIAGILLITSAGGLIGFLESRKLINRAKILNYFILSLEIIECEISQNSTPLPEIMKLLASRELGAVSMFYNNVYTSKQLSQGESFNKIWHKELTKSKTDLFLTNESTTVLTELGTFLFCYDSAITIKALNTSVFSLRALFEELKETGKSKQRLFITTGICFGAMISIIIS